MHGKIGGIMKKGCYTALVTPFANDAKTIDHQGLEQLVAFQIQNGITGILAVGTTGESPTLSWKEHLKVTEMVINAARGQAICIAGTGSNNTKEAMDGTEHAAAFGAQAVLLVDPYYNGPSSLEIRREYVAPIAKAFPGLTVIPYVIPGRTGAQLLPEDLALLHSTFPNVDTVKEATADIENMKRTRACCGDDYLILSGDDGMTLQMMMDPTIAAGGVISVVSNIAPKAVADMVHLWHQGKTQAAEALHHALTPLFNLVTVKTTEKTPYGAVVCRARNPLAVKTLMSILGLPSGACRQPLGRMTRRGLDVVLAAARQVQQHHPEIFQPAADFFGIDVEARLDSGRRLEDLYYDAY